MNAREYDQLFKNCCEGMKESPQSVDVDFVLNFNKRTRWTGMAINLVTRKVDENPAIVAKSTYFGESDGGVYTAVINLEFAEIYIIDFFGELVETLPLTIDDGVIHGRLQNYL